MSDGKSRYPSPSTRRELKRANRIKRRREAARKGRRKRRAKKLRSEREERLNQDIKHLMPLFVADIQGVFGKPWPDRLESWVRLLKLSVSKTKSIIPIVRELLMALERVQIDRCMLMQEQHRLAHENFKLQTDLLKFATKIEPS